MKRLLHSSLFLPALLATLLAAASPADATDRLVIYTVNYPLQYFARRIAGAHAEVVFPVPADVAPAFWQPDIDAILGFQQADLVLLNGAGYARWVQQVTLPRATVIDTSAAFRDHLIGITESVTHSHGPGGKHSHTGTASRTWLDPQQAMYQAAAIRDALVRLRPANATDFAKRYSALEADLQALDASLRAFSGSLDGAPLLASHPVYHYLARRYALDLVSMRWSADMIPAESAWAVFSKTRETHPARLMLWDAAPAASVSQRLRALGVEPVVFLTADNVPESGDFITGMQQNVDRLMAALASTGGTDNHKDH